MKMLIFDRMIIIYESTVNEIMPNENIFINWMLLRKIVNFGWLTWIIELNQQVFPTFLRPHGLLILSLNKSFSLFISSSSFKFE